MSFTDISGNKPIDGVKYDSWTSSTRVHTSPPAITILVTLRLIADNPLPTEAYPMVIRSKVKNGKVLKVKGSVGNRCTKSEV